MRDVIAYILIVTFLFWLLDPETLGRLAARVVVGFQSVAGGAP